MLRISDDALYFDLKNVYSISIRYAFDIHTFENKPETHKLINEQTNHIGYIMSKTNKLSKNPTKVTDLENVNYPNCAHAAKLI